MILQENGEDINIPNVVNKLKSSKPNNYVTGIVLVVSQQLVEETSNESRQKSNMRRIAEAVYVEGSLTINNPLVCWVTNCE